MAAAVAATTVEPTAATAVEIIATVPTTIATTVVPAAIAIATVSVVTSASVIPMTIEAAAVIAPTVEAATVVAAVVPGAGADEDAADEVVRSVVAVRSAGVRIVAVVTKGADRRWADGAVYRTYPDSHANLGLGAAGGEKQNS